MDRWQDVLGSLKRCDFHSEGPRVRQTLDRALAAARSHQVPECLQEQLSTARGLIDTSPDDCSQVVQRLLADVDDAEALLMLGSSSTAAAAAGDDDPAQARSPRLAAPKQHLQQQQHHARHRAAFSKLAAAGRGLPVGGTYAHLGAPAAPGGGAPAPAPAVPAPGQDGSEPSFPIPLHDVPRKPRTRQPPEALQHQLPPPAAAAGSGGGGRPWGQQQQQQQHQQQPPRGALWDPSAAAAAATAAQYAGPSSSIADALATAVNLSVRAGAAAPPQLGQQRAGAGNQAAAALLAGVLGKAAKGDADAAQQLAQLAANWPSSHKAAGSADLQQQQQQQPGAGILSMLAAALRHQQQRQPPQLPRNNSGGLQQQQQQQEGAQQQSAAIPRIPLNELQAALGESSRPLPEALQSLLASLGVPGASAAGLRAGGQPGGSGGAVDSAAYDAAVAALHAAALNRRKRSAEAAGLSSSPVAADAAAASPRVPGSSSLQQHHHQQQHPPADADDEGAQLSPAAAQLMRALGLPCDSEKAALIEHIRELLRQRGATSETQVCAFMAALPRAVHAVAGAAAVAAGQPPPANAALQDLLPRLGTASIVQATQHVVNEALQGAPVQQQQQQAAQRQPPAPGGLGSPLRGDGAAAAAAPVSPQTVQALSGWRDDVRKQKAAEALTSLLSVLSSAAAGGGLDAGVLQQLHQLLAASQHHPQQQQRSAPQFEHQPEGLHDAAAAAAGGQLPLLPHQEQPQQEQAVDARQAAAVSLLKSVGAEVRVQLLSAAAAGADQQPQQPRYEMLVKLPADPARQQVVRQLVSKLTITNTSVCIAQQLPQQQQQQQPVSTAVAVSPVGLHGDLVQLLLLLEPGSFRHKNVWSAVELLESSAAFVRDVAQSEAAAAAAAGASAAATGLPGPVADGRRVSETQAGIAGPAKAAAAASSQQPSRVQFVTRPRPAVLDQAQTDRGGGGSNASNPQAGPSDAAAAAAASHRPAAAALAAASSILQEELWEAAAQPDAVTHSAVASATQQLRAHFESLRELKGQIESAVRASSGGGGATSSGGGTGTGAGASASAPAASGGGATSTAGASSALRPVRTRHSSGGGGSGRRSSPPGWRTPTFGSFLTPASSDAAGGTASAAAPLLAHSQQQQQQQQPLDAAAASLLSSWAASNTGGGRSSAGMPPAVLAQLQSLLPGLAAAAAATPHGTHGSGMGSGSQGAQQQQLVQSRLGALSPGSVAATSAAALQQLPAHADSSVGASAAAAAAAATAAAAARQAGPKIPWHGCVMASADLLQDGRSSAGSAADGSLPDNLMVLFSLSAELPVAVAARMPSVLVVVERQPRAEIAIDMQQSQVIIMRPSAGSTAEQLALLQALSAARTGLVAHLVTQQQVVLCPEGSAAGGALVVVAVLLGQQAGRQQQPPAGAAEAAHAPPAAGGGTAEPGVPQPLDAFAAPDTGAGAAAAAAAAAAAGQP